MSQFSSKRPILIVTVDTEEEWDWSGPFPTAPFSTENIKYIPEFQELCAGIGICPTYFVDYAVVAESENRRILQSYQKNGDCDVGAHLHPWCTPPINEVINTMNSHAINLPLESFKQKMIALTDLLHQSFGIHPFSFRSGRWGINGPMLRVLAEIGYKVDSSVRPFYSDECFSYDRAFTHPYRPSFESCLEQDEHQQQILEIPTSSGFNYFQFEQLGRLHRVLSKPPLKSLRLIGALWALGAMRKISVTPEGYSVADICSCMKSCVRRGDGVINMFFHSSDLLPGSTDYVKDETGKTRFYETIEACVNYAINELNAENMTMRQAHAEIESRMSFEPNQIKVA